MPVRDRLQRLVAGDLDGAEPRIVDLEHPIRIIGMSVDTDVRSVYRDVPALGKRFGRHKRTTEIPNRKEPWAFAAVSKDYGRETGAFVYIMGDIVTTLDDVPSGFIAFTIRAQRYAVFTVRPRSRFGWGLAIASTKRYAYDEWLPDSGYTPGGVIDDFEYHDERSVRRPNPEIDLYIAIEDRR
jgi:predicted transcriptional regulator YdeE